MSMIDHSSDDHTTPSPALAIWAMAMVWGFACGMVAGWVVWG